MIAVVKLNVVNMNFVGCKYTPRHKCYHEISSPITDKKDIISVKKY